MTYDPRPVDTSQVELPDELAPLLDRLAQNTHDVWAHQRLREGWTYGPARDDARRQHPDLIPFDQLPDAEKAYDVAISREVLKVILASGYRVTPAGTAAESAPGAPFVSAFAVPRRWSLADLLAVWRGHEPGAWAQHVGEYVELSERFLAVGEPLLAYDVVGDGLAAAPQHLRLRQLEAFALARAGATRAAAQALEELLRAAEPDAESIGMLARTEKDLAEQASSPDERRSHLLRAFDLYQTGYERFESWWLGINAAMLAHVLDRPDEARRLADEVQQQCTAALQAAEQQDRPPDYWLLATFGEAALVRGERDEAATWYRQAARIGAGQYASIASTRRNASWILEHDGRDTAWLDDVLGLPTIAVFAGQWLSASDQAHGPLADAVARSIATHVAANHVKIGYAAASSDTEILFLEAVLEQGGEVHVVLPFEATSFKRTRIDPAGPAWAARFTRVLERASSITIASEAAASADVATSLYEHLLVLGVARIRATHLSTRLVGLACWGQQQDGPAHATAEAIRHWREAGLAVTIIPLSEQAPVVDSLPDVTGFQMPAIPDAPPRQIRAMLFGDARGFSKLNEHQVGLFARHFLGLVGRLVRESRNAPLLVNTWGDGLFFVFESVHHAGLFATELVEALGGVDWEGIGLPPTLGLRVGLHAGPVYELTDPVTSLPTVSGVNVSYAARIEPITPPGQVFVSEPLAALAAATGEQGFSCTYVGRIPLAKGYGTFPMYHLRPTAEQLR